MSDSIPIRRQTSQRSWLTAGTLPVAQRGGILRARVLPGAAVSKVLIVALAVVLSVPISARAQIAAELDDCVRAAAGVQLFGTYDYAIHHCSKVIRDGRVPEEILEWVLTQRGAAYQGKGAVARAATNREQAQALAARANADLTTAREMAVVRQQTEMERRVAAVQRATDAATRAVLRAQIT